MIISGLLSCGSGASTVSLGSRSLSSLLETSNKKHFTKKKRVLSSPDIPAHALFLLPTSGSRKLLLSAPSTLGQIH